MVGVGDPKATSVLQGHRLPQSHAKYRTRMLGQVPYSSSYFWPYKNTLIYAKQNVLPNSTFHMRRCKVVSFGPGSSSSLTARSNSIPLHIPQSFALELEYCTNLPLLSFRTPSAELRIRISTMHNVHGPACRFKTKSSHSSDSTSSYTY